MDAKSLAGIPKEKLPPAYYQEKEQDRYRKAYTLFRGRGLYGAAARLKERYRAGIKIE
jgi:hypothetical protein